ncbi:MAG: extracellular solute-binding protein [Clostridia bacterium]|nr:extracellular solute-binding protein [Clostridia bacterium]
MKKTKRTLSLCLLLVLMLSLLLTACSKDPATTTSTPSAGNDVSQETSKEEEFVLFSNLPDVNYNGETFKVIVEGDHMTTYMSVEFLPQESSYDTLKKAVGDRNDLIAERFGVEFEEFRTTSNGQMVTDLTTNAMAGTSEYDMVMPYMSDAATLALEGYFYDLNDLDYINLDMDYYDQGSVKDLSVAGKNYFVTGDLSLLSLACTHAIIFNKDVIGDRGLENPFDLVKSGKWTLDKMLEMSRQITANDDDNPEWTHKDSYGFLINDNFVNSLYIGAGQRFTTKNNNDEPIVAVDSENAARVYDKIYSFVTDTSAVCQFSAAGNSYYASATNAGKNIWVAALESIAEKTALFRAMAIIDIFDQGDYECDFGVLPTPKLDEAQDEYYSRVSTVYATCVAIPKNVRDPEMSAVITDALMQASTETTKYAYFETIMQDRKVADNDSSEMLQYIFDGRVYDLASIYHWGGTGEGDLNSISGFMNAIAISGANTFTSQWEAIESAVLADMEDTLDAYYND